jgi:predicted CXXCH cytochrome family protein
MVSLHVRQYKKRRNSMKKVLSVVAVTGLVAASTAAFGGSIVNSKHNLTTTGTTSFGGGTSTQICVYCHAPHNAVMSRPLWNRINPAGNTFTLYSGLNMQNVSFKSGFTADSTSLFCMSCHDGVTKLNAIHNAGAIDGGDVNGATGAHSATVNAKNTFASSAITAKNTNLGGYDLTKTHPINFPVSTVDGQSDLNVGTGSTMGPGQAALGGAYSFTVKFPLFKTSDSRGGANSTRMLECGSCHAVHDSTNSPFLRDTMNGSQLCLGCHNK